MPDPLAPSPDEFRAMARAALECAARYYESLPTRPVFEPTTSQVLRESLSEPLPTEGADFESLLETVESLMIRYSRHSAHPRLFGYICSPGTAVNAAGGIVASALNANVTAWRSSPAATEVEHVAINWLKEMLGYPDSAAGLFTSGGSMANLAGLAAARSAKAPVNVVRQGMAAAGTQMCVYVSAEGHFSVGKAAGILGIGEANVRSIRTDPRLRMDLADLERQVEQDRAAGRLPFCVVASAGTTATGAFDPIGEIAAVARRRNLWLHVDAAYGAFAALAPSARHLFDGIAQADSVALDPHKWLYLPMGCGCILYRDPAAARAAFGHEADYIRTIGLERDEAFAFWDYGPELSRPFRALDVWMLIKAVGTARLSEAVEQNIACAKYLEKLVRASRDFEMLAPVELSVFCFRYKPGSDADNERILLAVQRSGNSYLSNAKVNGRFALRGCVLNYRTTFRDMEIMLEDVRKAALAIL